MSKQHVQTVGKKLKELYNDLADARAQEIYCKQEHDYAQDGVRRILQEIMDLEKQINDCHV